MLVLVAVVFLFVHPAVARLLSPTACLPSGCPNAAMADGTCWFVFCLLPLLDPLLDLPGTVVLPQRSSASIESKLIAGSSSFPFCNGVAALAHHHQV
jgi:hypothetical protein